LKKMGYAERLRHYEAEKRQLCGSNLSVKEYERARKKLVEKWKI